jgi:hypothetical protein
MLIKELVESQQITGAKATWALAAIGYFAKTPTRQLLHELIVSLTNKTEIVCCNMLKFGIYFPILEPAQVWPRSSQH